jgi:hypothetical protein
MVAGKDHDQDFGGGEVLQGMIETINTGQVEIRRRRAKRQSGGLEISGAKMSKGGEANKHG